MNSVFSQRQQPECIYLVLRDDIGKDKRWRSDLIITVSRKYFTCTSSATLFYFNFIVHCFCNTEQ